MQILVILVNHTSTRKNMADHKLGSRKQLFLTFPTSFIWFTMRYTNRTLCELYDSHTPLHFENEPLSTPLPAQSLLRVLLCVLLLLFHYVITLRDFLLHSFLVCKIFPLSNSLSNMSKHFWNAKIPSGNINPFPRPQIMAVRIWWALHGNTSQRKILIMNIPLPPPEKKNTITNLQKAEKSFQ